MPGGGGGGRADALWAQLEAFRRHLEDERHFSPHTVRAYLCDLRPVVAEAARLGVADVEQWTLGLMTEVVGRAQNRAASGPACGRTVARKHSALKAFYAWRLAERADERDPTDALVAPEQLRKLPRPVRVEAAVLMAAPADVPSPREARAAAAMMLLYGSGLRLGESSRLEDRDLDLNGPGLVVRAGGRVVREVPVPGLCGPHLARWRRLRPAGSGPTFLVGRGGGPLACRTIGQEAGRLAAERLGRHLSPRQLRHSFAVHLLDHGASLRQVQALVGHVRVSSTQIYREVSFADLEAAHAAAHPSERGGPPA